MSKAPNLDDYIEVAERIKEFREKYETGTLQSECNFITVDGRSCVVVKASAYRTPDDERPGTGLAYEFIPGRTPYTKDSELQNAETAAWGRAIIAVGAADAKKIASREEVRNRTAPELPAENEEGRRELTKLCEEKNLPPEAVAVVYEARFNRKPRNAPNDELKAFVGLVREGVVTIDFDGKERT